MLEHTCELLLDSCKHGWYSICYWMVGLESWSRIKGKLSILLSSVGWVLYFKEIRWVLVGWESFRLNLRTSLASSSPMLGEYGIMFSRDQLGLVPKLGNFRLNANHNRTHSCWVLLFDPKQCWTLWMITKRDDKMKGVPKVGWIEYNFKGKL